MPACATRYAGRPPISAPRKRTEPALGLSAPAMRLNTVLLPEPLGPIRPRISPSATSNETLLTAVKPPKLFVSCSTFSNSRREGVALELLKVEQLTKSFGGFTAVSNVSCSTFSNSRREGVALGERQ